MEKTKQIQRKISRKVRYPLIIITAIILARFSVEICLHKNCKEDRRPVHTTKTVETTDMPDSIQWVKIINAIIRVESSGIETAVNSNSGATGVLQIMPIYVSEANRILGRKKFTLRDRLNKEASIEMFNIIQEHYNPEHNIRKAIHLHNPNAGEDYYNKVIKELNV